MRRSSSSLSWVLALAFVLPSCLVSFNEYPVGDLQPDGGESGASSSSSGATSAGAKAPLGGSAQGGTGAGGSGATAGSGATLATGGSVGAAAGTDNAGASNTTEGGSASVTATPNPLLDDFEDSDSLLPENEGRNGSWYAANDGGFGALQTPAHGADLVPALLSSARAGSSKGAHTFGGPFSTWGALIGTALALSGDEAVPYDLSGYQGIRAWVRSGSTNPYYAKKVRFNLATTATADGAGKCTACNDHFGADVALTTQWAQVEVPFSSLKQRGFGKPALTQVDLTQALTVEFLFVNGVTFDLWIDDVELY